MNNFAEFLDLLIYLFSLKQSDNNYNFPHQPQLTCVQHLKLTKIIVNTLLSVEMHVFKRKDALDLWSLLFQRSSESVLPKHNKHVTFLRYQQLIYRLYLSPALCLL